MSPNFLILFPFVDSFLRCTIDLSLLSKEHTHKLDLPLEEGEGVLVLLVTLTASAAVSISDLSVNMLDDPHERHQIMQRYVSWSYSRMCSVSLTAAPCEFPYRVTTFPDTVASFVEERLCDVCHQVQVAKTTTCIVSFFFFFVP